MAYQNDTLRPEAEHTHPSDPQQIGSGKSTAPGGADAAPETAGEMTLGQEDYPGPRAAGEIDESNTRQSEKAAGRNNDPPEAGDVDPASTASSVATGQDGDTTGAKKATGNPWNG